MKRQFKGLAVGAVAALTLGLLAARSSSAVEEPDGHERGQGGVFSRRSIKGSWGYNSSFAMLLPPVVPQALPFAGMGRISFDGDGGCEVWALGNLNGTTIPSQSSSCRYEVNPDGTGTSEATFPGTPIADPVPVSFVIVDNGREIRFLNTKFFVGTFTARRQ